MNGQTSQFPYGFEGGPEFCKIVFRGYSGDDSFRDYTGINVEAYGGAGRDTLHGGGGWDLLVGGPGLDHLYGNGGEDTLYAANMPCYDTILAPVGKEPFEGLVFSLPDCEFVTDYYEFSGYHAPGDTAMVHDYLYGGRGNDKLYGGDLNDRMWGDDGCDELYGAGGEDRLWGGDDQDLLRGGQGDDRLWGEAQHDRLYGDGGEDRLYAGAGSDRLYGGGGNDVLLGEAGSDRLFGGPDNDHLLGGAGRDRLYGGGGNDGLFGGADAVRDELHGDGTSGPWGEDRFLTRQNDVMHDLRQADVEMAFLDECDSRAWASGTENWTDREVYWSTRFRPGAGSGSKHAALQGRLRKRTHCIRQDLPGPVEPVPGRCGPVAHGDPRRGLERRLLARRSLSRWRRGRLVPVTNGRPRTCSQLGRKARRRDRRAYPQAWNIGNRLWNCTTVRTSPKTPPISPGITVKPMLRKTGPPVGSTAVVSGSGTPTIPHRHWKRNWRSSTSSSSNSTT